MLVQHESIIQLHNFLSLLGMSQFLSSLRYLSSDVAVDTFSDEEKMTERDVLQLLGAFILLAKEIFVLPFTDLF